MNSNDIYAIISTLDQAAAAATDMPEWLTVQRGYEGLRSILLRSIVDPGSKELYMGHAAVIDAHRDSAFKAALERWYPTAEQEAP